MAQIKESFALARFTRFLGFLIGIFGAMAILGVFFRIVDWGPYQYFMWIGFMGEAAAFVIMGLLELVAAFVMKPDDEAAIEPDKASRELVNNPETSASGLVSIREMVPQETSDHMSKVMETFTGEVQRYGQEMQEMVSEMQQARSAMQSMRSEITSLAGGVWAEEAERLGRSLHHLSDEVDQVGQEMEASRVAVGQARSVLDSVASSNLAGDAERFETGMRVLSEEIHEMGAEMGPARSSIQKMRSELDKVVSGDLAGDAERLGTGMRSLGDEMQSAGSTVEKIRDDLDQMAHRFRQFNHPMIGNGEDPSTRSSVDHATEHHRATK